MIQPQFIGVISNGGQALDVNVSCYQSNPDKVAVVLRESNGQPYAHCSVNTEDEMGHGEFVVHHDIDDKLLKALKYSLLFRDTGRTVDYGFVKGRPVLEVVGL